MNKLHKAFSVAAAVVLLIGLVSPAMASERETQKTTVELSTENPNEIEFYDYHTGTVYTGTLHNLIFYQSIDKNVILPDEDNQDASKN